MLFFLHKLFQNLVTFIIRQKHLLILFCIKHNFNFVFLRIHRIQILFVRPISTSLRQCAHCLYLRKFGMTTQMMRSSNKWALEYLVLHLENQFYCLKKPFKCFFLEEIAYKNRNINVHCFGLNSS